MYGDLACLDAYAKHGRIAGGDHDTMLDAAHTAWAADRAAGRNSLLVAANNATVTDLNQRARGALVTAGQVTADGVELRDGTTAGVGDVIVTRENARRRRTTDGRWVRNGDTWRVTGVHPDGALSVRAAGSGLIPLPELPPEKESTGATDGVPRCRLADLPPSARNARPCRR